jgi:hypothetical protein
LSTASLLALAWAGCQLVDPDDFDNGRDGGGSPDGAATDGAVDAAGAEAMGAEAMGSDAASDAPATCDADLMTDDSNCGRCGHSCSGGGCSTGRCVAVKVTQGDFRDFAYFDGVLYYASGAQDGGISAYDLDSGLTVPLVDGIDSPTALAVAPPYLIWAANGQIQRSGLDGGGVTTLATIPTTPTAEYIQCITSDSAGDVLWINDVAGELDHTSLTGGGDASVFPGVYSGGLGCVRADNSGIVTVGGNQLVFRAPNGGTAKFSNCGDNNSFVALFGTNAYCYSVLTGVYAVSVTGGAPLPNRLVETVPKNLQVIDIAADGQGVYWSLLGTPGEIHGCSDLQCDGGATVIGLSPFQNPLRLAVTPDAIYFNEASNPWLMRLSR